MTRSRALAATFVAAVLALPTAGCGRGPSDAELRAMSSEARATVIDVSDELIDAVQDGNPDLTFVEQRDPTGPATSWDCSDSPAASGEAIQWAAHRTLKVESPQPTDTLLDPLIDLLLDGGWALSEDKEADIARVVTLTRDGYGVEMSGDHTLNGDDPTWVMLATYSPCLKAAAPE